MEKRHGSARRLSALGVAMVTFFLMSTNAVELYGNPSITFQSIDLAGAVLSNGYVQVDGFPDPHSATQTVNIPLAPRGFWAGYPGVDRHLSVTPLVDRTVWMNGMAGVTDSTTNTPGQNRVMVRFPLVPLTVEAVDQHGAALGGGHVEIPGNPTGGNPTLTIPGFAGGSSLRVKGRFNNAGSDSFTTVTPQANQTVWMNGITGAVDSTISTPGQNRVNVRFTQASVASVTFQSIDLAGSALSNGYVQVDGFPDPHSATQTVSIQLALRGFWAGYPSVDKHLSVTPEANRTIWMNGMTGVPDSTTNTPGQNRVNIRFPLVTLTMQTVDQNGAAISSGTVATNGNGNVNGVSFPYSIGDRRFATGTVTGVAYTINNLDTLYVGGVSSGAYVRNGQTASVNVGTGTTSFASDVSPGAARVHFVFSKADLTVRTVDANGAPVSGDISMPGVAATGSATVPNYLLGQHRFLTATYGGTTFHTGNLDSLFIPGHTVRVNAATGALLSEGPALPNTQAEIQVVSPASAPDLQIAGRIAFTSNRDGNNEIYTMNSDGTGLFNLTNNPADDRNPAWSPDGTKVAFQSYRNGNADIYMINADRSNLTRLTINAAEDAEPEWSPDGTRIVFISYRDGGAEIYTMNADGTNQVRRTNVGAEGLPDWSPDGSKILFTSGRDGISANIYMMNPDGTGQTPVLITAPANEGPPRWSPDGTKIVFGSGQGGNQAIQVMNANGTGIVTALTDNLSINAYPTWSPDGTRIAFHTTRHGSVPAHDEQAELYVINADSTGLTRITINTIDDRRASWLPFRRIDSTAVGTPVSRTMTIRNTGNATLNVSNITSNSGQFLASPTSFVVAAGDSQNVNVTFNPTSAGTKYDTLTISSNDSKASVIKLIVNGTGTVPVFAFAAGTMAANTRIAFISQRDGNAEIYSMNPDGTDQTRLTSNASSDGPVSWSPDGLKMALRTFRDGNAEIYVMNADGSGLSNLTNNFTGDHGPAWSPDGTKIAFQATRDGNNEVYVMNADGSGPTNLTGNPASDSGPAWSPDGTKIAFHSSRDGSPGVEDIYVMNADGTSVVRLTTHSSNDYAPSWSPDGTKIIFASTRDGNEEIYIMNADGTGQTRLTSNTAAEGDARFSPNGSKIVFATNRDGGQLDVYQMNPDGTAQARITDNGAVDEAPSWSPFFRAVSAGNVNVGSSGAATFNIINRGLAPLTVSDIASSNAMFTVSPSSLSLAAGASGTVTVTFSPASATAQVGTLTISHNAGGSPALVSLSGTGTEPPAPDLQIVWKILFVSDRDGNNEVYVMDPDGTNQTNLSGNAADDSYPSWSPDGSRIAFSSNRDGDHEVYKMNADGTGVTRLTNSPAMDAYPAWSPEGDRIAFISQRDGNYEVYVMNADGSGQTRLTSTAAQETYPAWSPDGTKIVFQTNRDGNYEVYAMNPDGTNQTNLSNNASGDGEPAWSPDGTKIAFQTGRNGNTEIYTMSANGAGQTRLASTPGNDWSPSWSPDGTKIVFVSQRDGNYEVYVMNADGTGQTRLTSNPALDYTGLGAWGEAFRRIGSALVGTPVSREMTVQNTGQATLNINSITSSDPQFSVSLTNSALAAGAIGTMTVTFNPASAGVTYATLTVTSNDPQDPTIRLIVNGTGTVQTVPVTFQAIDPAGAVLPNGYVQVDGFPDPHSATQTVTIPLAPAGFWSGYPGVDKHWGVTPQTDRTVWMNGMTGVTDSVTVSTGQNRVLIRFPLVTMTVEAVDQHGAALGGGHVETPGNPTGGNPTLTIPGFAGGSSLRVKGTFNSAGSDSFTTVTPQPNQTVWVNGITGVVDSTTSTPGQNRVNVRFTQASTASVTFQSIDLAGSVLSNGYVQVDGFPDPHSATQTVSIQLALRSFWAGYPSVDKHLSVTPEANRTIWMNGMTGSVDSTTSTPGQNRVLIRFPLVTLTMQTVDQNGAAISSGTVATNGNGDVNGISFPYSIGDRRFATATVSGVAYTINNLDTLYVGGAPSGAYVRSGWTAVVSVGTASTSFVSDVSPGAARVHFVFSKADLTVRTVDANGAPVSGDISMNGVAVTGSAMIPDYISGQHRFLTSTLSGMTFHTGNIDSLFHPGHTVRVDASTGAVLPEGPTLPNTQAEIQVVWSPLAPDLRIAGKIAFVSNRDGNNEIYVMNPDGSGLTNLTNNPGDDRNPAWSPDGTKIAFQSYRDGNAEIYVMNADGAGQSNLTQNPTEDDEPDWSPDGSMITFGSYREGGSKVFVMNANGTNQTKLVDELGGASSWSPDGSKMVFASGRDGISSDLYMMNADGTNQTRLTTITPGNEGGPTWSPDGSKIAFSTGQGGNQAVFVMNAGGTGMTPLTDNLSITAYPAWSPEGARISFQTTRHGSVPAHDEQAELYVINADSTGLTRITNNAIDDRRASWLPFRHIGSASAGASISRAMIIQNTGNATLTVSSISSTNTQFSVTPTNLSLAAGASGTVTVTFTPTSAGTKYDTLTISSNDPDTPTINLVVNGTGTTGAAKIAVARNQDLAETPEALPQSFSLDQSYPNPFNPAATIRYALPEASNVSLVIYNILGQQVRTLVSASQGPGYYTIAWDGRDGVGRTAASGVYFYRLQAGTFTQVRKMLFAK